MDEEMKSILKNVMYKLDTIENTQQEMKQDMLGMKQDMVEMKQDQQGMKQDMLGMKQDIAGMKQDIAGMKQDIAGIKKEQQGMKKDISAVKNEQKEMKKQLELLNIRQDEIYSVVTSIDESNRVHKAEIDNITVKFAHFEGIKNKIGDIINEDRVLK